MPEPSFVRAPTELGGHRVLLGDLQLELVRVAAHSGPGGISMLRLEWLQRQVRHPVRGV